MQKAPGSSLSLTLASFALSPFLAALPLCSWFTLFLPPVLYKYTDDRRVGGQRLNIQPLAHSPSAIQPGPDQRLHKPITANCLLQWGERGRRERKKREQERAREGEIDRTGQEKGRMVNDPPKAIMSSFLKDRIK